jgi:NADH-quinone oxidoreductase subunit N
MIAYSSIAHTGYLLLAFALPAGGEDGAIVQLSSLWYYLVAYAIATAGALTAIAALSGREDAADDLAGLAGRGRTHPLHGLALTVFMASFAGIPPTAGFLAKYLVLAELVAKDQVALAIIAILMAVVGAAYYLRLVITVWSAPSGETGDEPVEATPGLSGWGLGLAALATIALVLAPGLMAPAKPPGTAGPAPATASVGP